jgi:hypothetical protein
MYPKAPSQNYWQPISELDIRPELNNKSIPYSFTIMFINTCRLFYNESSDDPIFPADKRWRRDPKFWINRDSRARPLACIDWIEVCNRNGTCSPPYEDHEDENHEYDLHYAYTRLALNKSTANDGIQFRGATGLDAQSRIERDISLPLSTSPPQWIVESWSLFNTSLARAQYDALDIAIGVGSEKVPSGRYVSQMPDRVEGKLCKTFMFQTPNGYDNVILWPTILILCALAVIWGCGWETKTEFSEEKKQSGYFQDWKLTALGLLLRQIRTCCTGSRSQQPQHTATPSNAEAEDGDERSNLLSQNRQTYGTGDDSQALPASTANAPSTSSQGQSRPATAGVEPASRADLPSTAEQIGTDDQTLAAAADDASVDSSVDVGDEPLTPRDFTKQQS